MELGVVIILWSSLLIGASAWPTASAWPWSTASAWPWTAASAWPRTAGDGSCNAHYTASSGELTSPQYPNHYPNYADCSWRISSREGMMIRLEFTHVDTEGCSFDLIHVYDGPSTSSALLETLCGSTTRTFYSSGSDLTIVFRSDSSVTHQGFVARWNFQDFYTGSTESPGSLYTTAPSCRWNCGYNLGSCSCQSSCQYYYGNCCHDYYAHCYTNTTIVPSLINTTSVSVPVSCGGSLFGSGSLSSPYYPNYYHDNAYCVWQLSAPAGERIFLSFIDLELGHCCNCDYVNVYDGSTTASPLLAKLCNNGTLQDFHSSSSYLTVLFRSDNSGVARGFNASFSSSLPPTTARVVCSSDNMTIVIRKSYLDSLSISWRNLYVDDRSCRPSANSYEVSFNFPLDMCGNSKKFNSGHIIYNNHVRAAPSHSGEITRLIDQLLLDVSCHMEQDTTAGTVYKAEETINSKITGTGRFNTTMAFYPSDSFTFPKLEIPYEVRPNQDLFVQVQLTRPDNTLDLFLDTCVASPNKDFQARTYTLLQNGCQKDNTVHIYTNGQHHYAQFRFKAFKFLRTHSYVFVQCRVLVCADNDHGSRCRQGCRMRRKRSLNSYHHTQVVTLGPITLRGAKTAAKVDTEE